MAAGQVGQRLRRSIINADKQRRKSGQQIVSDEGSVQLCDGLFQGRRPVQAVTQHVPNRRDLRGSGEALAGKIADGKHGLSLLERKHIQKITADTRFRQRGFVVRSHCKARNTLRQTGDQGILQGHGNGMFSFLSLGRFQRGAGLGGNGFD